MDKRTVNNYCVVGWEKNDMTPGQMDYQFSSDDQSCPTVCNPMDCSTPGFPVHHQLLELTQTHVHQVREAIQPSCPLFSLSRLAFHLCSFRVFPNDLALCFHQNILQWVSSSHQGTKVLEIQLQHQSFQMNIQGWFPLGLTGLISFQTKGLSAVFSSTTIWKHQFFSAQSSFWSNSHICIQPLEKPELWLDGPLLAKWCRNSISKIICPRTTKGVTAWTENPSLVLCALTNHLPQSQ